MFGWQPLIFLKTNQITIIIADKSAINTTLSNRSRLFFVHSSRSIKFQSNVDTNLKLTTTLYKPPQQCFFSVSTPSNLNRKKKNLTLLTVGLSQSVSQPACWAISKHRFSIGPGPAQPRSWPNSLVFGQQHNSQRSIRAHHVLQEMPTPNRFNLLLLLFSFWSLIHTGVAPFQQQQQQQQLLQQGGETGEIWLVKLVKTVIDCLSITSIDNLHHHRHKFQARWLNFVFFLLHLYFQVSHHHLFWSHHSSSSSTERTIIDRDRLLFNRKADNFSSSKLHALARIGKIHNNDDGAA